MAKPKKVVKKKKRKRLRDSTPEAILPTERSAPASRMRDYTFLIYGRKKIGKTSTAAEFPGSVLFMFEPGSRALRVYRVPTDRNCLANWQDGLNHVRLLRKAMQEARRKKTKPPFQTVCFDPGNKAFQMCLEHVCKELQIKHPGKVKDFGASWNAVSQEFQRIHGLLAEAGLAFIVLAHEKTTEFEDPISGITVDRVQPKFSGSALDYYEGVVDVIGYYHYVGKDRFLQIRGSESVVAGCRCQENFLTTSGKPVVRVPMGNSPKEAYRNLVKAFNNKQTDTFAVVGTKGGKGKKKVRRKRHDS